MTTTTLCRKCKQPAKPVVTVLKHYPGSDMASPDHFCIKCNPDTPPAYQVTITTDILHKHGLTKTTVR